MEEYQDGLKTHLEDNMKRASLRDTEPDAKYDKALGYFPMKRSE